MERRSNVDEENSEQNANRKSRRGRKRNASPNIVQEEEHTQRKTTKLKNDNTTTRQGLDEDTDNLLTEDEMSVNTINKNKAKLFSHILNPKSKTKSKEALAKIRNEDALQDVTSDQPSDSEPLKSGNDIRNKTYRNKSTSPSRKKTIHQNTTKTDLKLNNSITSSSTRRGGRKQPQSAEFVATTDEEEDDDEDEEKEKEQRSKQSLRSAEFKKGDIVRGSLNNRKENLQYEYGKAQPITPKPSENDIAVHRGYRKSKLYSSTSKSIEKSMTTKEDDGSEEPTEDTSAPDLVTVNMDDLTDLLHTTTSKSSKTRHSMKQEARQVFFARKSEPNKGLKSLQNLHRQKSTGALQNSVTMRDNAEYNNENGSSALTASSFPSSKGQRNNKMKSREPPNSMSSCPLCDKTFKIKTNLQLHLEKVIKLLKNF